MSCTELVSDGTKYGRNKNFVWSEKSKKSRCSRSLINTSLISTVLEITTFFKMAFLD